MEGVATTATLAQGRYRISFLRDGYTGEITQLLPSGTPLKPEIKEEGDSRFVATLPGLFTVSLACQTYWDAQSFYVKGVNEILVQIEWDATGTGNSYSPYAWGFVQPTELKEFYGPKPYLVEINVADGLSLLKTIDLLDTNGKRLQGFVSESLVLRTALARTGLSLDLVAGLGHYELSDVAVGQTIGGNVDPSRCPLYQTMVRADRFVKDSGEVVSCYDAIKTILESTGCRISQRFGQWWVLEADICAGGYDFTRNDGDTVLVRNYTSTNLADAPTSFTSLRLSAITDHLGELRVNEGSYFQSTIESGVRVAQTFGRSLSKLGDFSQVDSTGLPLNYYTNNIATADRFREGSGTEIDPWRMVLYGAGDEKYNNGTPYILKRTTYSNVSPEYTRYIKRTFKCRARLTNLHAAKLVFIAVRDDGAYLHVDNEWVKYSKLKKKQMVGHTFANVYRDQSNHDRALPGWFDISVDLGELDRVINFEVYYCVGEALDHFDSNGNYDGPETGQSGVRPKVEYQAGTLEAEQQGFVVDGTQQTIVQAGKTVKDTTLTITLGDVPDAGNPNDRIGTTFRRSTLTPTTKWYKGNQAIGGNGENASEGRTRLQLLTESHARQDMFPATVWEGTLVGRLPYGIHSVVYVEGMGEVVSGTFKLYPFQIVRLESDLRMCLHTVTLVRMMVDPVTLPVIKGEWQSPQGLIPMELNEDGSPINPPDRPFHSFDNILKDKLSGLGILPTTPRLPITVPALFTPQDPTDPQFTGTGYVGGIRQGTVFSALRQYPFLTRPA